MVMPDSTRAHVARRIRELRNDFGKTGLSQEVLAAKLGVATNTISRWETGVYEPNLDDLDALSRELGVSILEFFPKTGVEDEKNSKVEALLRTARNLDDSDLEELHKYAEFRRARSIYTPKNAGRKRK